LKGSATKRHLVHALWYAVTALIAFACSVRAIIGAASVVLRGGLQMMQTHLPLKKSEPVDLLLLKERYGNLNEESLRWKIWREEFGRPSDTTPNWMIEQYLGGKGRE